MSLWVDKYRPADLSALSCHAELTEKLRRLVSASDLPHLLFYGPPGAGKKTRILAILKELFGSGVEKIKLDTRQFTTPSNRAISINVISSVYHLEVTPSDIGFYDRVVVQDLIKEIAQAPQLDRQARQRFKVVVIHEADTLTRDAQTALRRTMEKYTANLRVILCCNTTSRVISPIRSRCLLIRVAAPQQQEIRQVLHYVAEKEQFKLPDAVATNIIEQANGNLRQAVLMLEATFMQNNGQPLSDTQTVATADWQEYIQKMATAIIQEQSPQQLLQIRNGFYELITHCIPAETILKVLTLELMNRVDDQLKPDIAEQAAIYDHRLRCGQKAIFHLEAFVAKFMSIYKRYLISLYG